MFKSAVPIAVRLVYDTGEKLLAEQRTCKTFGGYVAKQFWESPRKAGASEFRFLRIQFPVLFL